MRILHLDEQRGWRGGEQQASYLIRGTVERGHEVLLAGRPGAPFLERDHGVALSGVFGCGFRNEADLVTAARLAREIRRHDIDILHAHTSHTHTVACIARAIAGRGKVVVSRRVDFSPGAGWFNRYKYRLPDRYVAISHRIRDVLVGAGVPSSKIDVVRSAVDPTRVAVAPISRTVLGVPEDAELLGNVGALVGHKDQDTLLRAMAEVVRSVPSAHLVIAGEGPLRSQLEALRDRLGLRECVHLLGYRDDVPAILNALDVFVMSSKEEGLGTSVLDAMAAGVPVVATAGGGIPEMVRPGETGLLAPVGDACALAADVVRVLREDGLGAGLSGAAREYVEGHFLVDRMVEGNLGVYARLLGKKEGP